MKSLQRESAFFCSATNGDPVLDHNQGDGMTMSLMQTIDQRMEQALASGDLQPILFHTQHIQAKELGFQICWVPALSVKNRQKPTGFPGGQRDLSLNPFLPPDPKLTVGKLGDYHHAVLNKFPVCERHLVIPRLEYADQRSPLQYEDFLALSLIMAEYGGLSFYNGGPQAGASQHHLHVQWLPDNPENASLMPFIDGLDTDLEQQVQQQRRWAFDHAFVYVSPSLEAHEYARDLFQAYQLVCKNMRLTPCADGLMPPMNLLIQDGWLLVVPRSQERFAGIALNALSFAGRIYVREPEQVDEVKQAGVMQVLEAVTI